MLDRFEKPLKLVCLILGALLIAQVARLAFRKSPVAGLSIPAVPTWIERTNVTSNSSSAKTNAVGAQSSNSARTNSAMAKNGTNSTNVVTGATNSITVKTNIGVLNSDSARTNSPGTNATALASDKKSTNSVTRKSSRGKSHSGSSSPKADLPPQVQARIDHVVQSEIFGSIPHPVPMGILGIAGSDVFLRTPSGQTGIVKEGAELDGVKILKIGINRVLVESEGEKQELMIFAGAGGESLMPKDKEKEKESTK